MEQTKKFGCASFAEMKCANMSFLDDRMRERHREEMREWVLRWTDKNGKKRDYRGIENVSEHRLYHP